MTADHSPCRNYWTAEREIREKLGLDMCARHLIGVYSGPEWTLDHADGSKTQQLTFFFLMEGPISPIQIQESEIAACQFSAPEAIPPDTMDCCKQKVRDWASFVGQTVFR